MIELYFEGKPQGKSRPRFNKNGWTYTKRETVNYEKFLLDEAKRQMDEQGKKMLEVPFCVEIVATFSPLKSWNKKKTQDAIDGYVAYETYPDIDNIVKIVLDGLQGVLFDNDKKCVKISAFKKYGKHEGLEVSAYEYKV